MTRDSLVTCVELVEERFQQLVQKPIANILSLRQEPFQWIEEGGCVGQANKLLDGYLKEVTEDFKLFARN